MFAARYEPPSAKRRRSVLSIEGESDVESEAAGDAASPIRTLQDSPDASSSSGSDLDGAASGSDVDMEDSDHKDQDSSHAHSLPPANGMHALADQAANHPHPVAFETISPSSKYTAVLQKLRSTLSNQPAESESSDDEAVPTHQLGPLPQPALPRDKRLTATTNHISNLDWLAKPHYASTDASVAFSDLPLSETMLTTLRANGFTEAFAVQVAVLRHLLPDIERQALRPDVGGDLLVNAATGSGKTLGYAIPIVESLRSRVVPRVRAIVLVPTKPLIAQVRATFAQLSKNTNLSIASLRSDTSVSDEASRLANTPDIVVSTPGRLVEHLTKGHIELASLQYLVIDEADRLLNQLFQNWCSTLMARIDVNTNAHLDSQWRPAVQKLVFSATLTTDAGRLAMLRLQRPRLIIVNDQKQLVNELYSVPPTLSEYKIALGSARSAEKPLVLARFLVAHSKLANVLVFAKSNEASLRLSRLLQLLFQAMHHPANVAYLNSTNNTPTARAKTLRDFAAQRVHVLVVTDLIARGIDVATITDVFNYDLPNSSRDYVHRVGRTARANQPGNAYTMCFGKGESKWFAQVAKEVSRQQEISDVSEGFRELVSKEDEEVYADCLAELQREVTA